MSEAITPQVLLSALSKFERRHGVSSLTTENLREIIGEIISPRPLDPRPSPPARQLPVAPEWPRIFQRLGPDGNVVESRTIDSMLEQQQLLNIASQRGERWALRRQS